MADIVSPFHVSRKCQVQENCSSNSVLVEILRQVFQHQDEPESPLHFEFKPTFIRAGTVNRD